MLTKILSLFVFVAITYAAHASIPSAQEPFDPLPPSLIMPWFCLQRCGYNVSEVMSHIDDAAELSSHDVPALNTVAFERYTLGPNGTLLFDPELFDMNKYILKNATLSALFPRRIAMVSSDPNPPQFLDWMRELFDNPDPFTDAIISELETHNLTGINVDFEPTSSNATSLDAARYAWFLLALRSRLAARGKILTVAAATWSPVWNLTLMADALSGGNQTIGYLTSMNTYTIKDDSFEKQLSKDMHAFETHGTLKSLVVGLQTHPAKFNATDLQFHFDLLKQHNVCRIAIWDAPLTVGMIPHLANLSKRCVV